MRAALVNGIAPADPHHSVSIADRGLNYGDGVFETMLLEANAVRFLDAHLERLRLGCERLRIACPDEASLRSDVAAIIGSHQHGVVKIVVTRGNGGRGYRPAPDTLPTRIVTLHDTPVSAPSLHVRWCDTRLSRNPGLAGIKHLNRLEHVLAQSEWSDASIGEGLMLDLEGELVCATAANVFIVADGELMTPDLRYCGVRGIMRGAVIEAAKRLGIAVREEPLWPDTLEAATEVFLTNAVRGVRSVVGLEHFGWSEGPVTQALRNALVSHA